MLVGGPVVFREQKYAYSKSDCRHLLEEVRKNPPRMDVATKQLIPPDRDIYVRCEGINLKAFEKLNRR